MKTLEKELNQYSSAHSEFTRRGFIKMFGGATLGGLSTLSWPQTSEAKDSLNLIKARASQNIFDEFFWLFVKAQYALKPGLIYMNTGTEGVMSHLVLSRLREYFRTFASNPYDAVGWNELFEWWMKETRKKVAAFLCVDFDEIVLTSNTTQGMGFVANGLDLREGDEVLTTSHEHEGGLHCWYLLRDRINIKLTELELPSPPEDKYDILNRFEDAITPQTKVMSFCDINYTTGLRMPVNDLCKLAEDHGIISVVDGAHAIGMFNLDLRSMGCDFYACSPHKWLNAPPGTGIFYMRKDKQDLIRPTTTWGYGTFHGAKLFQFNGQQCTPALACLGDAMDLENSIGRNKIQERVVDLNTYLKGKIIENWGEEKLFTPYEEDPTDRNLSTGLASFNPTDELHEMGPVLNICHKLTDDYNIIIRFLWFKDKESDKKSTFVLRVSTHIYTNYEEIDRLISALKAITAT